MTMRHIVLSALAVMVVFCAGCPKQQEQGAAGGVAGPEATAPEKDRVKVTAYINVSSGCQAPTVELVRKLKKKYSDVAKVEIVDFGSPEGRKRWEQDGMKCMGILFDAGDGPSPAVRIPDGDGTSKTVLFFMPAGFSWDHSDLKRAFAALKNDKLEILSKQEAVKEFKPKAVQLETTVKEAKKGLQVMVGGRQIFRVDIGEKGKSAKQRATEAMEVIDAWSAEPVHPNQVQTKAEGDTAMLTVGDETVIEFTKADAKAAGVNSAKKMAEKAQKKLRKIVVDAVRTAGK